MLQLRPYQVEAVQAVQGGLLEGWRRQLVVLPTGTGKTVVMADLARRLRRRTLVLVHRRELAEQTVDKFELVLPGVEIGVVQGRRNELGARHVTVASVDTLEEPGRLAQLAANYALVLVDEAHHAVSPKWLRLVRWARCFEPGGSILVGFTATPQRADGVALGHVFERIAFERSLIWAIAQGYLCDLRGVAVRTRVDLDGVHVSDGELAEPALAAVVNVANRNALVVQAYRRYTPGRKALCFTVDVAHAEALAQEFARSGVPAAAVSGRLAEGRRAQILRDLRAGRLLVVTNCAALTEGYDEPSVSAIHMARPLISQALYSQCVGRGTRPFPGKRDCIVVDYADNASRLKLQALPSLGGKDLQVELRPGEGFRHALARQVQLSGSGPPASGAGLQAEVLDLFQRSRFNWLPSGPEMVLRLDPQQSLRLVPDPERTGHFHVYRVGRQGRQRLSDRSLDVGYAQGLAEDWARARSGPFAHRDAAWRGQPATERQLLQLRRHGIAAQEPMTRGQASDLLERIFSARS